MRTSHEVVRGWVEHDVLFKPHRRLQNGSPASSAPGWYMYTPRSSVVPAQRQTQLHEDAVMPSDLCDSSHGFIWCANEKVAL